MATSRLVKSLAIGLLALAMSPMAYAQATRTWVSGVGDDANPCSRTAPCKTFAGAISKTASGGEISVLDPGGFGVVTITKSITINGEGTLAGVLNAGTNGIIINATATDRIIIRNISINGAGTGINGIRFLAGRELIVENSTITGITGIGVDVALAATNGTVTLKNVRISNAATGVRVATTSGTVVANLDNVDANALTTGLEVSTGGNVLVRNSLLNRNSTGILVSAAGTNTDVEFSSLSFNGTGLNMNAAGTARLNNNAFYNNGTILANGGAGTIASTNNNRMDGGVQGVLPNGTVTTH